MRPSTAESSSDVVTAAGRVIRLSVPWRDALAQTFTLAWRAAIKTRRNPEQLTDVTALPVLLTLMFGVIFGGAVAGGVGDYLHVLIPGMLAMSTLTACIAAGIQLREDMEQGVFDRFRSMAIARIAPLAGPMIADLLRYLLASSLVMCTGLVLGYRPAGGVLGSLAAVLFATVAAWSLAWIFTWIGTFARSAQSVQGISTMVLFPLTFLSNALVPVSTMPAWLQSFVSVNPVSRVVSAVTNLLDGEVTVQIVWALLACLAVVAIFVPLSVRGYSKKL